MRKQWLLILFAGIQLASSSVYAMGSAPSKVKELTKIVRAEEEGSYSVCDGGFHFFFFNSPYSKAEDEAQDGALKKAKDKCENMMGGEFEESSTITKRCRPTGNYFGQCGFDCTAVTSGKCKIPDPTQDPRIFDESATPKKITVEGINYLIDDQGVAHVIEGSKKVEAESGE